MPANIQDLTLERGERGNSTRPLARLGVPLHCCFQVGRWFFLLVWGNFSNCCSICAFAFGFQVLGMSVMNKVCNIFDIFEYKCIWIHSMLPGNAESIDVLLVWFQRKGPQYMTNQSNSEARIPEPNLGQNKELYWFQVIWKLDCKLEQYF